MDANQLLHEVHDRDGWRHCVVEAETTELIPLRFPSHGTKSKSKCFHRPSSRAYTYYINTLGDINHS